MCPTGTVCDDVHAGCVTSAQLDACAGLADGTACEIASNEPGVCRDQVCLQSVCGDGLVTAPEQCDGPIQGALADCSAHGFHESGAVGCTAECRFDRTQCQGVCGDGVINGDELCEPGPTDMTADDVLGGRDCRTLGYHEPAGLACSTACTLDVTNCSAFCGDGITNGDEDCDGTDLGATSSCTALGFYDGGVLGCDVTTCRYNTTACLGWCGDGLIGGTEECDPGATTASSDDALDGRTCLDFGFYEPDGLVCSAACTAVTDACTGRCGDGVLDPGEDCDAANTLDAGDDVFGGDCTDLGYYEATTIQCTPLCGFDDSACTGRCGDRIVQTSEACDSRVAEGESCLDFGFDGGPLVCGGACAPDLSECTRPWTQTSVANAPQLTDAWAAGPDQIVVVGYNVLAAQTAVALHWNGTSWITHPVTAPTYLTGVWGSAANNIFAVGYDGAIVHWDGSVWSQMISGTDELLEGVWGTSASDVYAVGMNGTIVRYDGTSWQPMSSGTTERLYELWASSPTDLFVVGMNGTILRGDGTSWEPMTSNTSANLFAVWGTGPDDVWAAGIGGVIAHWDGNAWSTETLSTGLFETVTGTGPDDVYAIGTPDTIAHWDGQAWSMLPGVTGQLYGGWSIAPGDLIAVGQATILRGNGAGWIHAGATPHALRSIASDGTSLYGVGNIGPILRWTGVAWVESEPEQPGEMLYDVWATDPSNVFAVGLGFGGIIRYYDGNSWSHEPLSLGNELYGVWGTSATNVYAVGGQGRIVHRSGSTWSDVPSQTTATLEGVWGRAANDVYAVGGGGTIVHHDGVAWSPVTSPTTEGLHAIWGAGVELFAVGNNGTILRHDGVAWAVMSSTTTRDLLDVWGRGPHDVFAVGTAGTLLHWDGLSWSAVRTPSTTPLRAIGGTQRGALIVSDGLDTLRESRTCTAGEQQCSDGRDDDCDGTIDCGDPDCTNDAGCMSGGACEDAPTITCGTSTPGSTLFGKQHLERYACTSWHEPARERTYRFSSPTPGTVTITLAEQSTDLDLIVMREAIAGGCEPRGTGCIGASVTTGVEVVTFEAAANATYYVSVDGPGNSLGAFTLELACP